jgi:translocation and assembly module TamB
MSPRRRIVVSSIAVLAILLAASGITGLLVVRSGWFRERVRERIVREIETATGGRAELGDFSFDWERLVATVSPLVLHGTEPAGEPPLLRVESVVVGLRVISALERKVDLASLRVEQPDVRIVFYPDGSNNLPTPASPPKNTWAQNVLNLAVRRYEVNHGVVEVDLRKVPLDLRGEDLEMRASYEPRGPRYVGDFASRHMRVASREVGPVEVDASGAFALDQSRLAFSQLHLATGQSRADLTGFLADLRSPRGTFTVNAAVRSRDVLGLFSLPIDPAGSETFSGTLAVSFADGLDYTLAGRASARGLGYSNGRLKIQNANANGELRWTPREVTLRGITATALGAKITGQAALLKNRDFHFEGQYEDLDIRQAANVLTDRPVPWSGTLAGNLTADAILGQRQAKIQATTTISPAPGGAPIEGQIDASYDQQTDLIRLGDSHVATPSTSVDVSGTLGQTLMVRARSTNLDDVVPALAMIDATAPPVLPLKLNRGEAVISGVLSGPLSASVTDLQFRGQATVSSASFEGHSFDRFSGDVEASSNAVTVRRLSLSRGAMQISGDLGLTARNHDFSDGILSAHLNVRNAPVAELAKEAGLTTPISGVAASTLAVSGTLRRPEADITLDVANPAALGEQIDRLRASAHYSPQSIELTRGEAELASGKLLFNAAFNHLENDWNSGDLHADVTAQAISVSKIAAFRKAYPDADAKVDAKATLETRVERGGLTLRSASGDIAARGVSISGEPVGDVLVNVTTQGAALTVRGTAQVRDTSVQGQGTWRLEGDEPGSATLRFSRMSIATLHDLVMIGARQKSAAPPFEGFLEGGATVMLPLRKPQNFQAEVKIDTLQLNAKSAETLRLGVQPQDIVIKNSQPIVVDVSAKEARIRSAQLSARDTNLEATGVVPFDARSGADLAVKGTVNLAILQLLNPDLLARGSAAVAANIRGSLRDPQLSGRMELNNASLYLMDVPNGIDSATGVVVFDRNRATIEKLTAETGGGRVSFGGFLEFAEPLIYRLQADLQQVRVRYPEDVSITANAQLSLNGTSEASTLSGSITLNRAAISAGVDVGGLLAASLKSTPAPPSSNEYLRGIRFDVRIESGPTFELETSLTRDVETSVDLRLRGTPFRPVLLGDISVDSGEVTILGNRYTINRGEIRFLNPVKMEPTLDMDLETKSRGVTVNISLSGSPQKLNVNYSSDPPLQSREIIALLAVGRDPSTATTAVADSQISSGSAGLTQAGGGLLGQAVSQQLSSRLQRFFGATRVKIDPTLNSVGNLPEARLTFEQQVSRDVTLTYITNLNRTQEQIVQVEWDLNRRWSAVAVRDANGLFGIDLQYKKRFK